MQGCLKASLSGILAGTNAQPYMEEFLEFVCSDKESLQSEGWPYQA